MTTLHAINIIKFIGAFCAQFPANILNLLDMALLTEGIFLEDLMFKPVDCTCPRCGEVQEKYMNTQQPFSPRCCDRLMIPNPGQMMGYRTDHTVKGYGRYRA